MQFDWCPYTRKLDPQETEEKITWGHGEGGCLHAEERGLRGHRACTDLHLRLLASKTGENAFLLLKRPGHKVFGCGSPRKLTPKWVGMSFCSWNNVVHGSIRRSVSSLGSLSDVSVIGQYTVCPSVSCHLPPLAIQVCHVVVHYLGPRPTPTVPTYNHFPRT